MDAQKVASTGTHSLDLGCVPWKQYSKAEDLKGTGDHF